MKTIPLTQERVAIVDDRDHEDLAQFKWYAVKRKYIWYAYRSTYCEGRRGTIQMHRQILGFPSVGIDHRNRDGLDNQRENLRLATKSQNMANTLAPSDNTSGVKGVTWHKSRNKWQAQIFVRGKYIYLGVFSDLEEAKSAHREAALAHFNEYANAT